FFQAEDGIRDKLVTGVQTCALPIFAGDVGGDRGRRAGAEALVDLLGDGLADIGLARGDHHLGAVLGHALGNREPDAAGGSGDDRSEERRVGKECRSRWAPTVWTDRW